MKAIILAAGIGSRLGKPYPKPLTVLSTGESILARQVRLLTQIIPVDSIIIVTGFKKDLIMEEFPDLLYVYNNFYDRTNTSKSLLAALNKINNEDTIWLNGDVVFETKVIKSVVNFDGSCMAVNTNTVQEEEVKYNLNDDGTIRQVSKIINDGLGEAVGINKISQAHLDIFKQSLNRCIDNDYFEQGLEYSIEKGIKLYPVDISKHFCVEVDNQVDLNQVNKYLQIK